MYCIMFACRAVLLHAILILLILGQKQSSFLTFAFLKTHALLENFVPGEILDLLEKDALICFIGVMRATYLNEMNFLVWMNILSLFLI